MGKRREGSMAKDCCIGLGEEREKWRKGVGKKGNCGMGLGKKGKSGVRAWGRREILVWAWGRKGKVA